MVDAACHASSLVHDIVTLCVGGAAGVGGSLLTLKLTHSNRAASGSRIIDQSGAKAGGDNVGGNKITNSNNEFRP